ncbi:MAG: tetratricopeptide repeat protein [Desulfosarcinaceae bacterium]|nr:tetratricopeptide repeat protein [Desulfosarcinaceae bacterium]
MRSDSGERGNCIAVLPFESLTDASRTQADTDGPTALADPGYFARGFVEDVITDLAHFHDLQVISSYTAGKIGAAGRDPIDEAQSLSIDFLLRGSLRRRGSVLRINTQLIETRTGGLLWAERYDAPLATVFDIQDDIVARVVGALSVQIEGVRLAAARRKPLTRLEAYDCWLRGMDLLRKGTLEADQQARSIFNQALHIDPTYARAYAGLSLSYFNEWSCQLWERWEETEKQAYHFARKAEGLDDADHVVQLVLGRILLYRRQFDRARHYFDKALRLNPNDADHLAQLATCEGFMGEGAAGEALFQKALRLNPYRNVWYNAYGAFVAFVQRDYERCVTRARRGPLTEVWVDLPGYLAAACAYLGQTAAAAGYLDRFITAFEREITPGHTPTAEEVLAWMELANPFRHDGDNDHLVEGIRLAGLKSDGPADVAPAEDTVAPPSAGPAPVFRKQDQLWELGFEGETVRLPEVKGFLDLARLLAAPGEALHCQILMGTPVVTGIETETIDDKARKAYGQRVLSLRAEIAAAEADNDIPRAAGLTEELDQLVEHLSKAMGLGKRSRQLNPTHERARAAVTWRIRAAIRKIKTAHPPLGRHLNNAIKTGTTCTYLPEKPLDWEL